MENYGNANYGAEEKDGKKRADASKNKRSSRKKPASKLTKAPTEDSDVMFIRKNIEVQFSPSFISFS